MWMMGCSDGGGFNLADSFNGRRLRPIIPRPSSSSSSSSSTTTVTSSTTTSTKINNSSSTNHIGAAAAHPCFSRIHGSTDHFVLNHHMATVLPHEQISKRSDFGAPTTVVSSRWNPTPEQLRTLEELYRQGTRTPTAEQIQQITAQLRRFGKIEGKNVFYWFQNHKARERQKRRRRAEEQQQRDNTNSTGGSGANLPENNKESGSRRTDFEVEEEAKNWALPTNCGTLSEETETMRRAERAVAAAAVASESKTHGWMQIEEEELKQRRKSNQTWKMMQQLHFYPNTHFMNTSITTSSGSLTATATTTRRTQPVAAAGTMRIMNSSRFILNTQNFSDNHCLYPLSHHFPPGLDQLSYNINGEDQSDQTLQLFPLRSSSAHEDHDHHCADEDDHDGDHQHRHHAKKNDPVEVHPVSVMGVDSNSAANYHFIEFL